MGSKQGGRHGKGSECGDGQVKQQERVDRRAWQNGKTRTRASAGWKAQVEGRAGQHRAGQSRKARLDRPWQGTGVGEAWYRASQA